MGKTLTDWQIVPLSGGGVCAMGNFNGQPWKTTRVTKVRDGEIQTESGSIYRIRPEDRKVSLWAVGLQLKRPVEYQTLAEKGIV